MTGAWLWIGAPAALLLWVGWTYDRLVGLRNGVESAWAQTDVQLARRHDLIPNLVVTVRGYMAHERQALERMVEARGRALDSRSRRDRILAEAEVGRSADRILAIAEDYPELRADDSAALPMEELTSAENRIAFARQHYNERTRALNNTVEGFPSRIVASFFGFKREPFYEVEGEGGVRPRVELSEP